MCKNPQAQAKYLEFTGAGLAPLSEALDRKEAMMAALGARLLEAPKAAVEAQLAIWSEPNDALRKLCDTFG